MTLMHILVFGAVALVARLFLREIGRGWLLLAGSVLAMYWMQPAMPLREMDFWLPTVTLALTVFSWVLITPETVRQERKQWVTGGVLAALVLGVALTRYLGATGVLTATRPPQTGAVLMGLALVVGIAWLLGRFTRPAGRVLTVAVVTLIGLFVVLKWPLLTVWFSAGLRWLSGQAVERATALDVRWLGFSYVAFRLIHTLRDRQNGRLPTVSLQEYINYVLFFPAFSAGPIDRLERFLKDLRAPLGDVAEDLGMGGKRLVVGLFKKFVIADSLALFALGPQNVGQVTGTGWQWVLVYAYALQIFFDFSGYTDIAIGLGRWLGIRLPENFNAPYLKPNLTQFWNNWHMTLTQWFRAYFFNPLTRSLRTARKPLPATVVILLTQVGTMVLIGLWHGIGWNFVLWGLWHGLGLFVQNRWTEWMRPRMAWLEARPRIAAGGRVLATVLTFHYVALGWVWFALPTPTDSLTVLLRLVGG